jgi:hypothetical protein
VTDGFFKTWSRKGVNNPKAKLSEDDVKEIRRLHASGKLTKHIAEDYGVAITTIAAIVTRRAWKHIID